MLSAIESCQFFGVRESPCFFLFLLTHAHAETNIGLQVVNRFNSTREKCMERVGFRLQLRTEMLDEYVEHHTKVWPDMLAALEKTGWHNYSIFLDRSDGSLFGYFETPDLQAALAGMASEEVNERWQKFMAPFFLDLGDKRADEGFISLENVFYLK
jgi:L-rhamnose mutarotase